MAEKEKEMREIKFRAVVIDDDGKERLEYNVWPTGPSPGMRHLRGFVDNGGFWMDCKRFEQFTGLKDKNGKEIYEGDIITCQIYERENFDEYNSYIPIKVSWNEKSSGFFPFDKASQWRSSVEEVEVLGNIYEQPELLTK